MIRKYYNHKEEPHNNHKHQEDKQCRAASSLVPNKRIAKLEWTQELFSSHGSLRTIVRTSDSLNERLPIKMAREKFQRKRYFSMKMIVGSTLKLTAKVFFS